MYDGVPVPQRFTERQLRSTPEHQQCSASVRYWIIYQTSTDADDHHTGIPLYLVYLGRSSAS